MSDHNSEFSGFDIAAVATAFGAAQSPYDDEQLLDADGGSAFGGVRTVETARALLAAAAAEAGLAKAESDAEPHAAEAAALGSEANLRDGERRRAEAAAERHQAELNQLRAVPSSSRIAHAEILSSFGKMLLLAGDSAIIANNLYLRGTEIWLAVLAGSSVATVSVAAGTAAGRAAKIAEQRIARGPAAEGDPRAIRTFFSEEGSGQALSFARRAEILAVVTSIGVGVGVMLLYRDLTLASIGSGLLALITAAGSYFLTSTTTNEVADRIEDLERQLEKREAKVAQFAEVASTHYREVSLAGSKARAGGHRSEAARLTTAVVADRRPADPRTHGYEDPHGSTDDVSIVVPTPDGSASLEWPKSNGLGSYTTPTGDPDEPEIPGFASPDNGAVT